MTYVVIDGADAAIIGYSEDGCTCYGYEELQQVFVDQGMDPEGAVDWISYNILSGGVPGIVVVFPGDRALIDELADIDDERSHDPKTGEDVWLQPMLLCALVSTASK